MILAFRHVPFEGAGHLETLLAEHGLPLQYVDLYRDGAGVPDVSAASGLVFLGGPMSANDDLPFLCREMDLIRAGVSRRVPVLGICLGAQLIAKALGAKVYRNPVKEIGWFDIHITEAGAEDPLLSNAAATETVLHWHGETFDLPAGACRLAWSERCHNQAYRLGSSTWGLQFHLEVTPAMIADWCVREENSGDVGEFHAAIDSPALAERMQVLSQQVFGAWCKTLKKAGIKQENPADF